MACSLTQLIDIAPAVVGAQNLLSELIRART